MLRIFYLNKRMFIRYLKFIVCKKILMVYPGVVNFTCKLLGRSEIRVCLGKEIRTGKLCPLITKLLVSEITPDN